MEKEVDHGSVKITLNFMSAGLYSGNQDVVLWCTKVLNKLALYLDEVKLLGDAYEWLIEPDGGLDSVLYCYDKHQDVTDSLISILISFGIYNLMELFT